jgi:iron complex outermembrane receptor protein
MKIKEREFKTSLYVLCVLLSTVFPVLLFPGQEEKEKVTEIEKLLQIKISTATKYLENLRDVPASVTVITSEDIERCGYRTLEEVFASVPGFYTSYDRNYVYLGSRGFSRPTDYNDRILLLLDGHTFNEGMYGMAPVGTDLALEMEAIERIEIVRGAHSALYGTSAMFSVINIITKKGSAIDGARLAAEAGSYGRKKGSVLFGKELPNGIDVMVSGQWTDVKGEDLYFEEYDDPATNNGIAQNADWDKYHALQARVSGKGLSFSGVLTYRKKGIPTGAWDTAFNDPRAKTLDSWSFLELKYDLDLSPDKNIMARAYFDHYKYEGTYPADIPTWDSTTANRAGGEIQFRWDIRPNNRLILGTEYQNHLRADLDYWGENTIYFDDNFPYRIFSLYIQDEYQITEKWSMVLGVRHDEYSTVGSSTTPRASLIYRPFGAGTLKLLYGEAFRAPNPYEVNYEDPLLGYKPNLSLKPEKIRSLEVIWEQRLSRHVFGSLNYYDYQIRNLIDQTIDPLDELVQFQNLGKVKARGLEMGIHARWENGIWAHVNYSWQSAKNAFSDEKLTNSPGHLFKAGISMPLCQSFIFSTLFQYESERLTVYLTKTEPYFLIHLNLTTNRLFEHWKASFQVRNFLNATYYLPGGFEHIQSAIIQPSRSFLAKIES